MCMLINLTVVVFSLIFVSFLFFDRVTISLLLSFPTGVSHAVSRPLCLSMNRQTHGLYISLTVCTCLSICPHACNNCRWSESSIINDILSFYRCRMCPVGGCRMLCVCVPGSVRGKGSREYEESTKL